MDHLVYQTNESYIASTPNNTTGQSDFVQLCSCFSHVHSITRGLACARKCHFHQGQQALKDSIFFLRGSLEHGPGILLGDQHQLSQVSGQESLSRRSWWCWVHCRREDRLAFSPSTSPSGLRRSCTRLQKLIGNYLWHILNVFKTKGAVCDIVNLSGYIVIT